MMSDMMSEHVLQDALALLTDPADCSVVFEPTYRAVSNLLLHKHPDRVFEILSEASVRLSVHVEDEGLFRVRAGMISALFALLSRRKLLWNPEFPMKYRSVPHMLMVTRMAVLRTARPLHQLRDAFDALYFRAYFKTFAPGGAGYARELRAWDDA